MLKVPLYWTQNAHQSAAWLANHITRSFGS